ncbi:hypothetical protein K1719_044388 [Acacia pycnantha]|nr:hypothetical protein K1719_044388 [Acacia pycnantha]
MFWALIAWTMELGRVDKFLKAASDTPETVLHYEFMQDYKIGPKGLEFGRYSLDYHTIRNYLYVNRAWGKESDRHMPTYAKKLVDLYNQNGKIDEMLSNK